MIPDPNSPRSSSPLQPGAGEEIDSQKQSPEPDEVVAKPQETSGTKVSHRAADEVTPTAHLTATSEAHSSQEELQKQLMSALELYRDRVPEPGENEASFKHRLKKIKQYARSG